jgi:hypothetical protein
VRRAITVRLVPRRPSCAPQVGAVVAQQPPASQLPTHPSTTPARTPSSIFAAVFTRLHRPPSTLYFIRGGGFLLLPFVCCMRCLITVFEIDGWISRPVRKHPRAGHRGVQRLVLPGLLLHGWLRERYPGGVRQRLRVLPGRVGVALACAHRVLQPADDARDAPCGRGAVPARAVLRGRGAPHVHGWHSQRSCRGNGVCRVSARCVRACCVVYWGLAL